MQIVPSYVLYFLLAIPSIVYAATPGANLLNTSNYGTDEYLVITLACFICFVVIKHLVFHTLYFWWFTNGRFYIPNYFWSFLTRRNLGERIYNHVITNINYDNMDDTDDCDDIIKMKRVLQLIDDYCANKEFAPNFSHQKGKLLTNSLEQLGTTNNNSGKKSPSEMKILMIGSCYGYVMITIMMQLMTSSNSDDDVTIYVIDGNVMNATLLTKLAKLVGRKVHVINKQLNNEDQMKMTSQLFDCDVTNYFVQNMKFDVIFLTRHSHHQQSHYDVIKLFEQHQMMNEGCLMIADKIVFFTDPQYLMYIRDDVIQLEDHTDDVTLARSKGKYLTTYHQMALEHNSYEVLDGIEISTFHQQPATEGAVE